MAASTTRPRAEISLRANYWLQLEITVNEEQMLRLPHGSARLYEGNVDGEPTNGLEVRLRRPIDADIVRDLELIAAGRVPDGTDRNHPSFIRRRRQDRPPVFDAEGKVRGPIPFDAIPSRLQSEVRRLRDELRDASQATAWALRWRLGAAGSHRTLSRPKSPEWSTDETNWHRLPGGRALRFLPGIWPALDQRTITDIERIASSGPEEPVAHAILREAGDNASKNPRSSLVLAVAAIEVGIKQFISEVSPAAGWLATEAPSPPVHKMIRDYLPTLAGSQGRSISRPPPATLKLVSDAIEARNAVAHRGQKPGTWPEERLKMLLAMARAFLYALDFVRGVDWAIDVLAADDQATWGVARAAPIPANRSDTPRQ